MTHQALTDVHDDEHERQIENYWAARDQLARSAWRRRGLVAVLVAAEALAVALSYRAGTTPARVGAALSVPVFSALAVNASFPDPNARDELDLAYSSVLAEEHRRQMDQTDPRK